MKPSKFTLAVLGLFAAFLLVSAGYFLSDSRPSGSWRVETERDAAAAAAAAAAREDTEEDSAAALLPGERININTASAKDLTRLPGIGEVRAQAIVDYRTEYGPFQSVEELTLVPGIGEGILSRLQEYITVEDV